MSQQLDARAHKAAAGVRRAVGVAELTAAPPAARPARSRLASVLRPAWVVALLMIGSAVGLALVLDSSPPVEAPTPTTVPALASTIAAPTTIAPEPAPPTTLAPIVPLAPAPTTTSPDLEAPLLEVTYPNDGAHLTEKTVEFAGRTEPGARVFAGKYEAMVDPSGVWRIVLILNEGSNVARFVARDQAGNESKASLTVHFVMPTTTTTVEPTPTTEKIAREQPDLAEFSARASFGTCSETPPYDVYYGTGQPGSLVTVESDYGSGTTEVGPEGQWELKVLFNEAPPGKGFIVGVSDEYDRHAEFEFVYAP